MDSTRDPVNQVLLDLRDQVGIGRLGLMNNQVWHDDPKRLVFTLARYKFVAKMLAGRARVLEVGCGDGFGARVVAQEVGRLVATDYDPLFIDDANQRMWQRFGFEARVHDWLDGPLPGASNHFDAAYSLDVLEHIPAEREDAFLGHVLRCLTPQGVLIVGMPSLESQAHASPPSRAGHVNCKSGGPFKATMERYFHNVFLFSMNDEVVHTGFAAMAHYLICLCTGKRAGRDPGDGIESDPPLG